LHEAARAGRTEIVEYLLKKGADVNERTNKKRGANALWWAEHSLPDNHPTIQVLRQYGGTSIGPNE
jgi:ankyrin repeat protein